MIRTLAFLGGLTSAVGMSQFPEFSQQYLQRLAGAVDELKVMAVAFDSSAQTAGLSRNEALAQLHGSAFQDDLRGTMTERLTRYDRLAADYDSLKSAEPLARLAQVWRFSDAELAQRTWDDYRPAVPVTTDGFICAGIGYLAGWGLIAGLLTLLGRLLRRPALR